jgi:hypothetical protein
MMQTQLSAEGSHAPLNRVCAIGLRRWCQRRRHLQFTYIAKLIKGVERYGKVIHTLSTGARVEAPF